MLVHYGGSNAQMDVFVNSLRRLCENYNESVLYFVDDVVGQLNHCEILVHVRLKLVNENAYLLFKDHILNHCDEVRTAIRDLNPSSNALFVVLLIEVLNSRK